MIMLDADLIGTFVRKDHYDLDNLVCDLNVRKII